MNSSAIAEFPLARQNGLVIQQIPDETLVYDIDRNKAHCLNTSAALVWTACDGKSSVTDIVRRLESGGYGKVNEDFVWLALEQFSAEGLLENKMPQRFGGESRRQVIKRIGLATAVAIPVIASLVAPSSALASSSCACSGPGSCITQTTCPSTVNCNASGVCAP